MYCVEHFVIGASNFQAIAFHMLKLPGGAMISFQCANKTLIHLIALLSLRYKPILKNVLYLWKK